MDKIMENEKKPIISVICPCYNQEKYLSETIGSVINQSLVNWELIIVDDGSYDKTAQIAKDYAQKDSRIKYLFQENVGPSAARNYGVRESQGKYLFFLDGDDKIAPDYLQLGVSYMEKDSVCVCFFTQVQMFGTKTGLANVKYTTYKNQLCQSSLWCCGLMRRTDFDRIGGFDETMKGFEDWEFFIRLLYKNDHVYIYPEPLFYYRIANPKSVGTLANKRYIEITSYIYEKHKEKYLEYWGTPFNAYHSSFYYQTELDKVLSSNAYIIGKKILKPAKWIMSKLNK